MSNFDRFYPEVLKHMILANHTCNISNMNSYSNKVIEVLRKIPGFKESGIRVLYARAKFDPFRLEREFIDFQDQKWELIYSMGLMFSKVHDSPTIHIIYPEPHIIEKYFYTGDIK